MNRKTKKTVYKAVKETIFYLFVTGLIGAMLLPVYFIISLSFLSTREAYRYPLPLVPALQTKFEMTHGERGYLLSVYDRVEKDYQTVLDTSELEKMEVYIKSQLGTSISQEEIQAEMDRLDDSGEDSIFFTKPRNLLYNYDTFFKVTRDAVPALIRSLEIAALTILISITIGGLAGYAFARYIFKGKDALKFSVLFVRMFPGVAIALPMVIILAKANLYDEPLGLSLIYSVGAIGLTIWITASIFMGIPESLEQAAQVFGATKFQAFMRITFPLALPGLAASAMYTFLGAWNETVGAIILTQFKPTFSVVVYQTLLGASGQVNLAAAGGIAMALPAVFFTFFIRRYINQMWGGVTV
ncbi:MAG: carbohydrate ABC transporter permease [Anaerolineaceae bacterium]|nr:carbohydrate ABC transporter permease [Anaerolineaceae bacterium]